MSILKHIFNVLKKQFTSTPLIAYLLIIGITVFVSTSLIRVYARPYKSLPNTISIPQNELIMIQKLKKLQVIKENLSYIFKPNSYKVIQHNIKEALRKNGIVWTQRNIDRLTLVLHVGEKKFKIDHKDVLSIIKIESNFKIDVTSKVNSNGTRDHGLGQINSENIPHLYPKAAWHLRKNGIWYSNISDKHDLALNVMSSIIYLNDTRQSIKSFGGYFDKKRWIQAYNTGLVGSISPQKGYVVARNRYWKRFLDSRVRL